MSYAGDGNEIGTGILPIGIALRHVLNGRRDKRVLQAARHQVRRVADDEVMFAEDHVIAVLLGAAGRHDDGGLPRLHRVARFFPRHLVDEHGVGRLRRRHRGRRRVHRRLELRPFGAGCCRVATSTARSP
jgi:hypothetical protein